MKWGYGRVHDQLLCSLMTLFVSPCHCYLATILYGELMKGKSPQSKPDLSCIDIYESSVENISVSQWDLETVEVGEDQVTWRAILLKYAASFEKEIRTKLQDKWCKVKEIRPHTTLLCRLLLCPVIHIQCLLKSVMREAVQQNHSQQNSYQTCSAFKTVF